MIQNEFKDEAQKYDSQYSTLLETKPSIENEQKFKTAIETFERLPTEVKKYSKIDIKSLREKYDKCKTLKDISVADSAYLLSGGQKQRIAIAGILAIYNGLTAAQRVFFKDDMLINQLIEMKNTSKEDYEDHNIAEKVKNSMSYVIESIYSPDRYDIDNIEEEIDKYESLTQNQKSFIPTELYEKLKKMLKKAQQDEDDYESRRRMNSISRPSSSTSTRSFSGFGGRSGGGGAGRGF